MTLYDNPTPPRREDPDERAAIDAHIAAHGVTQCPPHTYSAPTDHDMRRVIDEQARASLARRGLTPGSADLSHRFANARKRRVQDAKEAARIQRLGEAGNAAKRVKADESVNRILEMRAAGMQLSQIAEQLGSTVGGIRGRIRAAKNRGAA